LGAAEPRYVLQSPGLVENCVRLYVPLLEFNRVEFLAADFGGIAGPWFTVLYRLLPPELAIDGAGEMTVDPFAAAALMPLGGANYGYKGPRGGHGRYVVFSPSPACCTVRVCLPLVVTM
jgi:hypothetical protein